ncbi:AMP-binding protein, partial [Mycobacteroides abscessus]
MTPSTQSSILSMLHGRASLRPDDIAFTFTDYTNSPTGVAESLTWSQLSRRTFNVARELGQHASPGDRALILAPQSLEYILAFLGSMQAGLIAVPLPLPHRGSSLDRVSAVFDDTSPSVVLTTS